MKSNKIQLITRILEFRRRGSRKTSSSDFQSAGEINQAYQDQQNQQKGIEFEQFVVRLFNVSLR
jgi:hypothetical protein